MNFKELFKKEGKILLIISVISIVIGVIVYVYSDKNLWFSLFWFAIALFVQVGICLGVVKKKLKKYHIQ